MEPVIKEIGDTIVRLRDKLLQLDPIAIYLFGSRARGEERPDSDIDLAVLLCDDVEVTVSRRIRLIGELEDIAKGQVDLVIVNKAPLPLKFEIIHDGKVLYESSFDARTDVEDVIIRDYLDLQPMYERNFRDILEDAAPGEV